MGLSRKTDPRTSQEAGNSVNVTEREHAVLKTMRQRRRALTTVEISEFSGIPLWTVSPRMKPLEEKGLIQRVGTKRNETSNRNMTTWKIV